MKKNKFKKLAGLLLASIMMLVALPAQTLAAEWGKGDTVYAAMIGDFVGSDGKAYADKYNYDYIYSVTRRVQLHRHVKDGAGI